MFFNEHPYNELSTEVDIPLTGKVSLYDAFSNTLIPASIKQDKNSTKLSLKLSAYESTIIVFGEVGNKCVNTTSNNATELLEIKVSSSAQYFPRFSGTMCFDTEFNLGKISEGYDVHEQRT